jgi:hypothetical protein
MAFAPSLKLASSYLLTQFSDANELPADTWYFIAAVALSTLNRPEEIADVFQFAISEKKHEEQVRIARRIREALIKSAPVVGLPKVRFYAHIGPNNLKHRFLGFNSGRLNGLLADNQLVASS